MWAGAFSNTLSPGSTAFDVSHPAPAADPAHDGTRTVIAVITEDTQSVTSIAIAIVGFPDGGFTARDTYSAQGKKISLFDKICGPTGEDEPYRIFVDIPAATVGIGYLADFDGAGDAIRAADFADAATGTALTLPSLTAVAADDIWTLVWSNPVSGGGGQLRPQAPLSTNGNTIVSSGSIFYVEEAHESWRSSAATGTRSYAVTSGSHEGAVGVIILVGEAQLGWGVGQIRMGAN
jgi:hypothetical protein